MEMGFSRQSSAPNFVASTAVSIVAWPLIISTGQCNRCRTLSSFRSDTPSVSGIQMSRRIRSNGSVVIKRRAVSAFSAVSTVYPSSERISDRSSRIPISSSTTRIFAIVLEILEIRRFKRTVFDFNCKKRKRIRCDNNGSAQKVRFFSVLMPAGSQYAASDVRDAADCRPGKIIVIEAPQT